MALPDPAIIPSLETEEQCVAYLERLRWPEGIACPNCGNQKISRFRAKGKSGKTRQICQCLDRECKYQFSATTGTIFHDSHLPLSKWFEAMRLLADPAVVTPVNQLRFVLGVQYKTAKNVAERIQRALDSGTIETATSIQLEKGISGYGPIVQVAKREQTTRPMGSRVRTVKSKPIRQKLPPSISIPLQPAAQIQRAATQSAKSNVPPTVVDSMLSVFASALNLSVKPPLAAVNYLKKKMLD